MGDEVGRREGTRLDLEGAARGTLDSGVLYGSVEDTVVDALASAKGAEYGFGLREVALENLRVLSSKRIRIPGTVAVGV